jgi:hypothetical protein
VSDTSEGMNENMNSVPANLQLAIEYKKHAAKKEKGTKKIRSRKGMKMETKSC